MSLRTRIYKIITSGRFRLIIGLLISVTALFIAFKGVDPYQVVASIYKADYTIITFAFISVMINNFSKALRWQVILGMELDGRIEKCNPERKTDNKTRYWKIFKSILIGQMLNWVFPARVGDLSRIYTLEDVYVAKSYIIGTIALEKVLDVLAYSLLFLGVLFLMPLPVWISTSGYSMVLIAFILLVGLIILICFQSTLIKLISNILKWLPFENRIMLTENFRQIVLSWNIIRKGSALVKLISLTIFSWVTAICTNYLIAQSLGLRIPWLAAVVVLILLQIGISFSQVPGMIGIFQYACVLSLSLFNIKQYDALTYGILLHITVMLPILLLGLLFLWQVGIKGRIWHEQRN